MQHVHTEDKLYVTVISERSGIRDDERTTAQCPQGYLLVGCKVQGAISDGLRIPDDGTQSCEAFNGVGGDGVIVSHTVHLFQTRNVTDL